MSSAPDWFDRVTGRPTTDPVVEPADPAARADAAVIAARAARASAAAATTTAPSLDVQVEVEVEVAVAVEVEVDVDAKGVAADAEGVAAVAEAVDERYGVWRLTAGTLGRIVLAFAAGCLVVTLLPLVIGWRPYVVKSGSMEPRLHVGDVVVASPNHDPSQLLGHVTVFKDPARPGATKSHRVIAVNPDGTMTTKGDANPTADPVPVRADQVDGMGRLLVRWAGLPLVWALTGQFLYLGLLLLGLFAAAWAVARDHEEYDDESEADGSTPTDRPNPGNQAEEGSTDGVTPVGPPTTRTAGRLERRARRRRARVLRVVAATFGAGGLVLPGASAAFSATTKTTGSSWTVPSYSYTTATNSFSPYLYWKLGDTGGTAADASTNGRTGTYSNTYTRSVTGGTPDTSPNTAVTATNATACINTTSTTAITGPSVFTVVVWFKSTSGYTGGGKLIGFESPRTGVGLFGVTGNYDRHIYMDGGGKIWFGVYNGSAKVTSTSGSYNDGSWHMAAATESASGMALYVDGVLRSSNANTSPQSATGWWRVGCGNLAGWGANWTGANNPGISTLVTVNVPFLGSLDEAAVFSGTALTASDISYLYWTR